MPPSRRIRRDESQDQPAYLTVPVDQMRTELEAQIAEGHRLRQQAPGPLGNMAFVEQLQTFENDISRWHRRNVTLLERRFSTVEKARAYDFVGTSFAIVSGRQDPRVVLGRVLDSLQDRINDLQAVYDSLDLFAERPTAAVPDVHSAPAVPQRVTNTFNIQGSVAQLAVGDQQTIRNIDSNIQVVGDQGEQQLAEALAALRDAMVNAPDLDEQTRAQALDAVEEVSEAAKTPPAERRLPRIMRAIGYIGTVAGATASLTKVWQEYGHVITTFLS